MKPIETIFTRIEQSQARFYESRAYWFMIGSLLILSLVLALRVITAH